MSIVVERKMQAPTHGASGVSAVINSAKFMSFAGVFIGDDGRSDGGCFTEYG